MKCSERSKISWGYIAGFFDGEGSIFVTKQNRKDGRIVSRLHISLTNTNIEVMNIISKFTNLQLHKATYGNMKYIRIDIKECGLKAAEFLKKIKPFSISKRKQIDLAIIFVETIRKKKNLRSRLTQKELKNRENILNKIKILNRRRCHGS